MSLFEELRRRNVFRVAIAYVLLGWAVLQGADFLLDLVGAPEWVIRALAVIGLVGLPFALVFAWIFELTPEGVKRERDIDRSQSITTQTDKKLNGVIIGLLLVIILLMAVERLFFAGGAEPDEPGELADVPKTIAVLPFDDLSQAQDQEWFADGLAEEILNALVKVPDLQVTSRTSSFAFKGTAKSVSEIAAELGVAHVLEGSVRSGGDRIRVTAQLIRASDGFHLWSQNYDRAVADMIGIQEDLARSIATALETTMDPAALAEMARVGTESVEAYREYLRGLQVRAEADTYSVGKRLALTQQAYEHFERARTLDPDFSEAHVAAAHYWKIELTPNRMETGLSGANPEQMLREYNARISRAIDTARDEADRIHGLAERALVDLRLREARELYLQYLDQRPNDLQAHYDLMTVLLTLGEYEEASTLNRRLKPQAATDLNSALQYLQMAWRAGDAVESSDVVLEATRHWPNADQLVYQGHRTLLWADRVDDARRLAERYAVLVPGGHPALTARQGCAQGDRAPAEQALEDLDPSNNNYLFLRWFFANLLGREDEEIALVRGLLQQNIVFGVSTFLIYPQFDPRPYPELMEILEREGVQRPPPIEPPFKCPPPAQPSVAVLPFVNMSTDPDNEYFSDGVAEEILNVLARIPELKVTARTSAFSYKGSDATVAQIAEELGVNHVLEGSVRKAGNRVRVTAQLIEAGDDFHLWSETYDRELDDIFGIQDEIAQSIAGALKVQLLPAAEQPNQTGTTDLDAYQLFLQGVNLWHLRTGESLEEALTLFQRATERDPAFARAHAYLALTWGIISDYTDRSLAETRSATRAAAAAALALDPDSVEAATARISSLLAESPADLEAIVERGRDLVARDLGFATTYQWHGTNLLNSGRVEEALKTYRVALDLDPRSRIVHQNLAMLLLVRGRFEEAEDLLQTLHTIAPNYWDGANTRFLLYLVSGRMDEAEAAGNHMARVLGRNRNAVPLYLDLYFAPERKAAAVAEILAFPRDNWWDPDNPALIDTYLLPFLLAAAGAHDEALQELRRRQQQGTDYYPARLISISPLARDFSCRPEVQAFFDDMGLPPSPAAPACNGM